MNKIESSTTASNSTPAFRYKQSYFKNNNLKENNFDGENSHNKRKSL